MRIVITDQNDIWNHKNPLLEKYKDAVLVVCLGGQEVTDKYECFVCPDEEPENCNRVSNNFREIGDSRCRKLCANADYLNSFFPCDEDVIILGDQNIESLYPFLALKNSEFSRKLHLCAERPWYFLNDKLKEQYQILLSDLTSLTTLFFIDARVILSKAEPGSKHEVVKKMETDIYEKYLPKILYGIQELQWERAYYDFYADGYVPLDKGCDMLKMVREYKDYDPVKIEASPKPFLMGDIRIVVDDYRHTSNQEKAEAIAPRLDGKEVCNYLRDLRMELAHANRIPFSSEECLSYGPCAGTCAKCDREATYLFDKLRRIPKEQRIYPKHILESWEGLL